VRQGRWLVRTAGVPRYVWLRHACAALRRLADSLSKVCPNLKALRKHFQAVHSETRHSCAVCGKSFGRTDLLSRHRKTCGIDKQFACVCAPLKPFKTVHNLKRHIAQAVDKGFPGIHQLLVAEDEAAMPEEVQEGQQEGMAPEAEQLEGL